MELILHDFWWPQMWKTVKDYVTTCDICSCSKVPRHRPYGLQCPLPIPIKLGPRYLWISLQTFQVPRLLTQSLWWLTDWRRWPILCHVIRRLEVKKLRDSWWIIFTSTMASLMTSFPIVVHSSPQSFGNHYSRSLKSRLNYLPHIILRLMDK
jgi:hypothetical protein